MNEEIDIFMNELKSSWRACPLDWSSFHRLLTSFQRQGNPKPPVPMILAASDESSASKHDRLREQLRWAAANECLDPAIAFLQQIEPVDWEHSDEVGWYKDNYPTF